MRIIDPPRIYWEDKDTLLFFEDRDVPTIRKVSLVTGNVEQESILLETTMSALGFDSVAWTSWSPQPLGQYELLTYAASEQGQPLQTVYGALIVLNGAIRYHLENVKGVQWVDEQHIS